MELLALRIPHVGRGSIFYSARVLWECSLFRPREPAISLGAPLSLALFLLEGCSSILFGFTSVRLPFPTHSSSGPQGTSFLLWAHPTRIRTSSWNAPRGSLPIMFCIFHLAWISILALLYGTLHQNAGPFAVPPCFISAAYVVTFSLLLYWLVGWIFGPSSY